MEHHAQKGPPINKSELIKVWYEKPLNTPGWHPSEEVTRQMGTKALQELRLLAVQYNTSDILFRLTFVFSGDIQSPPGGTYLSSPSDQFLLPSDSLGKLTFGLCWLHGNQAEFCLCALGLYDRLGA